MEGFRARCGARARLLGFAAAVMVSGTAQAWQVPLGYSFGQGKLDGHTSYANDHWNDGSFESFSGEEAESSNRFFAGVFPWDTFGLEYARIDFGTSTVSAQSSGGLYFPGLVTHKLTADGDELSLVGRIPLGGKARLLLRLGQLHWDGKERIDAENGFAEGEDDGEDVFFGLGVDYPLGPVFLVRGEYTEYRLDDFDVSRLSVSLAAVIGPRRPASR